MTTEEIQLDRWQEKLRQEASQRFANTIIGSDVEVKDYQEQCDLCHDPIFIGIKLDSWFVCRGCGLNYTEDDLRIELENETKISSLAGIGMCMECGELSEHSDLCSRNIGEENN